MTVSTDGDLSFAGGMPRLVGFIIDGISAGDSYGLGDNKTYPTNILFTWMINTNIKWSQS